MAKSLEIYSCYIFKNKKKKIEICKNCTYLHTAKDNVDNLTEEKFMERVSSR